MQWVGVEIENNGGDVVLQLSFCLCSDDGSEEIPGLFAECAANYLMNDGSICLP